MAAEASPAGDEKNKNDAWMCYTPVGLWRDNEWRSIVAAAGKIFHGWLSLWASIKATSFSRVRTGTRYSATTVLWAITEKYGEPLMYEYKIDHDGKCEHACGVCIYLLELCSCYWVCVSVTCNSRSVLYTELLGLAEVMWRFSDFSISNATL